MNWIVSEAEFDPAKLRHQETVFTIGNGYLGTRGTFEEGYPDAQPATLIHGVFDAVPVVYTELANCPDWLPIYIFVEGERFRLDQGTLLAYRRELDVRRGVLSREVRWRSPAGHTLDLHFERFASLADEHVVAIRCTITAIEKPCAVTVQAGINGYPDNMGLFHWIWLDQGVEAPMAWLHTQTRHSDLTLGMAMRMTVSGASPVEPLDCRNCPTLATTFLAQPGHPVVIEKTVTLFTSRDVAEPVQAARERLAGLPDYATLRAAHEAAWAAVWEDSDVLIEGDPVAQRAVRHSLFQILAAVPRHDDRVSVSAKTLSGFGYRGHVFWDTEIFLLPFLTYTQPALARNLLTYRYHTLPGARRKARANGYEGAMVAWESAQTGDEVTPRWVPGPQGEELVRIWCGDIELHITADVAYAVWHYWQATGDDAWMCDYGAEILLDTAVFWGSRAEWNPVHLRYEINDVIGPDENHEHVNNNAFTNGMVRWHLQTALDTLAWLQATAAEHAAALTARLDLTPPRLAHWRDIIERLVIRHDLQTGLIEQCDGFFALKDIDLADYEPRTKSMQAILGIEGANQHQVLKQADVLMLLYLLRDRYDDATLRANWDYYNPRTDHTYGSSLSPAIHAALACMIDDPQSAYTHFMRAALVDLDDGRGNAAEGVHAASAGGLWQALVFGFAGVYCTDAGPVATPRLPTHWTRLKFRLHWRGRTYDLDLRPHADPTTASG
ncbi:MAG TPA: glycoside hydrolase family 65 protein [Anaerolineae bacterium]|nr:glycoside hydrolase family 65 protein [Anaerolineae bacterium]HQH39820.1 glycoside hydrolase family 65 protein [Anaerolineae bacterium]